jgi:hypothetical protein
MKERPKLFVNICNWCGATNSLIPDKFDFYICTCCGGQAVPPNESKRETKKQITEAMQNISSPVIKVHSKVCSGSKSKGSGDKRLKMQRPSTTQMYNALAGSNNRIIYREVSEKR